jgi:glycosyltransferase involved in cell wall biosynthesis
MIKKKIILIDAVFINDGGGKILLDYLFEEISKSDDCSQYLFLIDDRLRQEYQSKLESNMQIIFIDGFLNRSKFYKKNTFDFKSVLCFGNIPPNVRLKAKVFTYFHQRIYLEIPKEFGILDTFKFKIKVAILKLFKNNTDFWMVQSPFMKGSLQNKLNIPESNVIVLPFYPPLRGKGFSDRKKNSFIFVSNANPHKNHSNLINAFCEFFDKEKEGLLTLTVNESFPDILDLIENKVQQGYPINNIGFVLRDELYKEYQSHQYLIFPSLSESFGLGLVEGIENGCKIIVSDLSYAHQVCEPGILIEQPQNKEKILEAMMKGLNYNSIPFSQQKIHNEIEKLINLLDN